MQCGGRWCQSGSRRRIQARVARVRWRWRPVPRPRPVMPEPVGRGRRRSRRGALAARAERALGLAAAGSELGLVADQLDRDVADLPAVFASRRTVSASKAAPDAPGPSRIGRAEHAAEVAEPGGREQRVAAGVGHDVAIGMAGQARHVRPVQAARPSRGGRLRRRGHRRRCRPAGSGGIGSVEERARVMAGSSSASARREVVRSGDLEGVAAPGMTSTGSPSSSTSPASSVMLAPAVGGNWARSRTERRKPCGVWMARSVSRGGVSRTTPVGIDAFDGVIHRQARHYGGSTGDDGRGDRVDQRHRSQRPRSVVDQHDINLRRQGTQSAASTDSCRLAPTA